MSGLKKRLFEVLGKVVGFVTAHPDLFGKACETKPPSVKVTQTRQTLTNTKTTKTTKGVKE